MAHAKFSPSAAKRWMSCPGSHRLIESLNLPDTSSQDADDGTATHDLAAQVLNNALDLRTAIRSAPSKEHGAALKTYVEYARRLLRRADWGGVEVPVRYSDDLFGTADLLAVTAKVLDVADLKCGAGVYVDEVENPQMMVYAALALHTLPEALVEGLEEVRMHVIQPRFPGKPPCRMHAVPITRLYEWMTALWQAMEDAMQEGAPLVPGAEQCRFCPAKQACPALQGLTSGVEAKANISPRLLPIEAMGELLLKFDLVEQYIKAVRDEAHKVITEGGHVPGWKLAPKRATRKWVDEKKVIAAAKRRGVVLTRESIMSPAQAEKLPGFSKALPEWLEKHVKAESSGYNLVRDNDAVAQQPSSLVNAMKHLKFRV